MWCFHVSFSSNITPRHFLLETLGTGTLLTKTGKLQILFLMLKFDPTNICFDFVGLRQSLFSSIQLLTFFKS